MCLFNNVWKNKIKMQCIKTILKIHYKIINIKKNKKKY